MITLFSIPKAFTGGIGRSQRNAIGSWLQLEPKPQIVLFGNDEGVAETASEFGLHHVPSIASTPAGAPLVGDVFRQAQTRSAGELLAYVNCDILLFQEFADAAARLVARHPHFLMVGCRTDLDYEETLDFSSGWQQRLRALALSSGRLHAETGIDYFVFRRGLWPDIPPFAVGRFAWDNWLLWDAKQRGALVVDATSFVLAVHQNHGYPGSPGPDGDSVWHAEIRQNLSLADPFAASFTILDAGRRLTSRGRIVPAIGPPYLRRRISRLGHWARTRSPLVVGRTVKAIDRLRSRERPQT